MPACEKFVLDDLLYCAAPIRSDYLVRRVKISGARYLGYIYITFSQVAFLLFGEKEKGEGILALACENHRRGLFSASLFEQDSSRYGTIVLLY